MSPASTALRVADLAAFDLLDQASTGVARGPLAREAAFRCLRSVRASIDEPPAEAVRRRVRVDPPLRPCLVAPSASSDRFDGVRTRLTTRARPHVPPVRSWRAGAVNHAQPLVDSDQNFRPRPLAVSARRAEGETSAIASSNARAASSEGKPSTPASSRLIAPADLPSASMQADAHALPPGVGVRPERCQMDVLSGRICHVPTLRPPGGQLTGLPGRTKKAPSSGAFPSAPERTRTSTDHRSTRPSTLRVYQFRHRRWGRRV